jgi:acetoin utilization protein AcuB
MSALPNQIQHLDYDDLQSKTARDLMSTDLVKISIFDTLDLTDPHAEWRKFRHIPVVDLDGKLRGLVSHRDLMNEAAASIVVQARANRYQLKPQMPVKEVMLAHVITVQPETPLKEVARRMLFNQCGCIPVITPDQKLVGIITEADFVTVFYAGRDALKA